MKRGYSFFSIGGLVVPTMTIIVLLIACDSEEAGFHLVPQQRSKGPQAQEKGEAAVGWSIANDPRVAVGEALSKAKAKLASWNPRYVYTIHTVGYSSGVVRDELIKQLPGSAKMQGTTSAFGVMTNEGLHKGEVGAVAVLVISSEDVDFGVGSASLEKVSNYRDLGKEIIVQAIKNAGRDPATTAPPKIVLYNGTWVAGQENRILQGIGDIVGADIPVIGGNAGDDTSSGKQGQFTREDLYKKGLTITAFFTDRPVGWEFESQFKLINRGGKITKSSNNVIHEIDGQPALDVFDRWIGGDFVTKIKGMETSDMVKYTADIPFARVLRGKGEEIAYGAVRPLVFENDIKNKTITCGTSLEQGDEIQLISYTWQSALNRARNVPASALRRGKMEPGDAMFGILTVCMGMTLTFPENERHKIPLLTESAVKGIPFIGVFTLGEQGYVPGIGNVNANLVESMIIFGNDRN